jgi:hypothetical protein
VTEEATVIAVWTWGPWFARGARPRGAGTGSQRPHLEALEGRALPSTFFPADNPWNQDISNAPVAANSAALVAGIGPTRQLHPDFGTVYAGSYWGIPYKVVSGSQPPIPVVIDAYRDESDVQPVPLPDNANDPSSGVIEGDPLPSAQNNGDRHALIYDQDNQILYELFNAHRPSETADGRWHADSEAVWQTSLDWFRPPGWTSADAAGLPIVPGLVNYDEVRAGVIDHALRFTVQHTRRAYVFPASHYASSNTDPNVPRMGERFRLRADVDISRFSPANQVILTALKRYGMIVADNGSNWFLSGAPDPRWNDDDVDRLKMVLGGSFEAVDLTPAVQGLDVSSGPSAGGTNVVLSGYNFSGGAGLTQVSFGDTPAASFQILSDTQLLATAPAHAAGVVDVRVSSGYGTSAVVAADQFTFVDQGPPPPTGSNRGGATAVRFADLPAAWFTGTPGTPIAPRAPSQAAGTADAAGAHAAPGPATALANPLAGVGPSVTTWVSRHIAWTSAHRPGVFDVLAATPDVTSPPTLADPVTSA